MNIDDNFITEEIHRRALLFCADNKRLSGELVAIETAMQIGASIVFEDMARSVEPEVSEADNILRVLFEKT
jgi:hypothetical protein